MHDCKTLLYNYSHVKEKGRADEDVRGLCGPQTPNSCNTHIVLYSPLSRELDSPYYKLLRTRGL